VKSLWTATFVAFGLFATAASSFAAHSSGKLTGFVVDPAGNPQMGATVWLTPEFAGGRAIELLTDENGLFVSQRLRPGLYSVKVTLAGFMPALQKDITVGADVNTSVHIELDSIFASVDRLRRKSGKAAEPDDWKWVLRSASSSRPVLQLRDGSIVVANSTQEEKNDQPRISVELDNGSVRPGSSSALPGYMGTSVSYDQGLGRAGELLMAGEVDYDEALPGTFGGSVASIWLPSRKFGEGPETTLIVRQHRLGDSNDRSIRTMRFEHTEQLALAEGVVLEYGGEYLSGGFVGAQASSLRPHARLGVHLSRHWDAAFSVETDPDAYGFRMQDPQEQPAIEALQTAPRLIWSSGNPVLDGGWHEELALRHDVGAHGEIETAVFRDDSRHEAVYGTVSGPSGYYSPVADLPGPFGYDAGASGFWGTRLVYREKIANNLELAAVYAWAGALAPGDQSGAASDLQQMLETRYRHSVAARVAGKVPKSKTQLAASYKWIDGTVVTRQDLYSETAMAIDPNLSLSIRQPLPAFRTCGRWEAVADFRNILSQGYVSLESSAGHMLVMPVERSFRGGVSFQF
jgi:hypothetical protein